MAGHMNGYINGARTELELKIIMAPSMSNKMMSGISHHFFSCLRKSRNSLASRNMMHDYNKPRRLCKSPPVDIDVRRF